MRKLGVFLCLTSLLGVIGGLLFGHHVLAGVCGAIAAVGSLIAIIDSERQRKIGGEEFEVLSRMMVASGAGNPHYKIAEDEMAKSPWGLNGLPRLRAAIYLEPNNVPALSKLSAILGMRLGREKALGREESATFNLMLEEAEQCVARALKIDLKYSTAHMANGLLLDVKGRHREAQDEFRLAGHLGNDAWFWRLMSATSMGMEGRHSEALDELRRADVDGATGWILAFYLGRSLNANGFYDEGELYLRRAAKARPFHPDVVLHLKDSFYFQAKMMTAAFWEIRTAALTFPYAPSRGCKVLMQGAIHIGVALITRMSKVMWPYTKRIGFIRYLQATKVPPDQPEKTLSKMLIREKHYSAALNLLDKGLMSMPENGELYLLKAECLAHLERGEEADKLLANLLEQDCDENFRREAERMRRKVV